MHTIRSRGKTLTEIAPSGVQEGVVGGPGGCHPDQLLHCLELGRDRQRADEPDGAASAVHEMELCLLTKLARSVRREAKGPMSGAKCASGHHTVWQAYPQCVC